MIHQQVQVDSLPTHELVDIVVHQQVQVDPLPTHELVDIMIHQQVQVDSLPTHELVDIVIHQQVQVDSLPKHELAIIDLTSIFKVSTNFLDSSFSRKTCVLEKVSLSQHNATLRANHILQ